MKKYNILISLLAIFSLVGCNQQPGGNSNQSSQGPADESKLVIVDDIPASK